MAPGISCSSTLSKSNKNIKSENAHRSTYNQVIKQINQVLKMKQINLYHKIIYSSISVTFSLCLYQTYHTWTFWAPVTQSPYLSGLFLVLVDLRGTLLTFSISGDTTSTFGNDKLVLCDIPELDKSPA